MLWQLVVLMIALWVVYVRYKNRRIIQLSNSLKNDYRSLPFIGHSYLFFGNGKARMGAIQLMGRQAIKYGGKSFLWLGEYFYVVVADPVVLDLVMKSSLQKDDIMNFGRELIGNGTLIAPVPLWRPRRKILAPTFSPKNLSQFLKIFSRQSSVMVRQLQKTVGTGKFSIWKYITSYAMDSVCETTLGVQVNAQLQPDQPFLSAFEKYCQLTAERFFTPWLHPNIVYTILPSYRDLVTSKKIMWEFIDKIITAKRKSLDRKENMNGKLQGQEEAALKTFLDLLIEYSGGSRGYSDTELQEELLTIVLAGTDTSAVGTSFAVLMLSRHPEIQEKVYQEIQDVFGESDRPVTTEDLPRLKYLDAVIRETLRLYPPAPVIVRKIENDLELPSGETVVKGCGVMVHIWATNRNPEYWGKDAEEFRPERFLDTALKHPASFQTFSYGPRGCIGYQYAMMSLKTLLTYLVKNYRILPANPQDSNGKDLPLEITFDVMMKDVDKFSVQLQNRK